MSSPGELKLEWWGPGTIPAPASVVWCNFPTDVAPGVPGPKPRPALVFKVRYADDPPRDRFYVQVAYGTSVLKLGKRPFDFTIANALALSMTRLPQATRFDLDRVLWLPWARPFFETRDPEDRFKRVLMWTMKEREDAGRNDAFHGAPPAPLEDQY